MGRHEIDVMVESPAAPAAVYALLHDGSSWPRWGRWDAFELERLGEGEREGVGAVRVWRVGRKTIREEIVELVPDRRFAYTLLSGLAVRDYRADVDLSPAPNGCTVRWHATFRAKVPGTGWLYRLALRRVVTEAAQAVATTAATAGEERAT